MLDQPQPRRKPVINVATAGHIDSGKSTIIGRLFTALGQIDVHEFGKLLKQSVDKKKATFEYAYGLDTNPAERERGITITSKTRMFETKGFSVTIIDCPGHVDYLRNMIAGSAQADHAILMINVEKGIEDQTEVHVGILTFMRVHTIIVVVNKMDVPIVNYGEERFREVERELTTLLKSKNYWTDEARAEALNAYTPATNLTQEEYTKRVLAKMVGRVVIIPAAGYLGENVFEKTTKMPWWSGPCLLQAIDQLPVPLGLAQQPFRMQISEVRAKEGLPAIWCGKVLAGSVSVGDQILLKPGMNVQPKVCEVKSIERHKVKLTKANAGDNVGITCRGIKTSDAAKGFTFCDLKNPAPSVVEVSGLLLNLHKKVNIRLNSEYNMAFGAGNVTVRVEKFNWIKKAGEHLGSEEIQTLLKDGDQEERVVVSPNELAHVVLRPLRTICIEPASKSRTLGRVILRTDTLVAVCAIDAVKEHQSEANLADVIARARL